MASTYPAITDLYAEAIEDLAENPERWAAFLAFSGRNYKLAFHEQVLVFAQRPDATAVLELEGWNERFGRRVRRGAVGIAVFGEAGSGRLRYYFDVSDTYATRDARAVPYWQVDEATRDAAAEALAAFCDGEPEDLATCITHASCAIAADNMADYFNALGSAEDTNGIARLECTEAMRAFEVALSAAIEHEVASRCGLETGALTSPDVTAALRLIDTPRAANAFGCAVCDCAAMALREVATSVLAANRTVERTAGGAHNPQQGENERSKGYENNLRAEWPAASAEVGDIRAGNPSRAVRPHEAGVSETEQPGALHEPAHDRHSYRSFEGHGALGRGDDGARDGAAGASGGTYRGNEADRPDGLGGTYEQLTYTGRGDGDARGDTRLTESDQDTKDPDSGAGRDDLPVPLAFPDGTRLALGDAVVLGTREYRLAAYNDATVSLHDPTSPLFPYEISRSDFERRLAESAVVQDAGAHEGQAASPVRLRATRRAGRAASVPAGQTQLELAAVPATRGVEPAEKQDATGANAVPERMEQEAPDTLPENENIGPAARVERNLEALRCLRSIEEKGRAATSAERAVLARYSGWGGLAKVFDEDDGTWAARRNALKSFLDEGDYAAARASVVNAFFTPPAIIDAVYTALEDMGFSGGNVLEPSCGTGAFFSRMPAAMRANSRLVGVELDPVTARIAALVHPDADIRAQGFEDAGIPDNLFDVAIGNVPFGDYAVADKRYDAHGFKVHDYFFARALDAVRPGGVVAFITSKGTLDKKNPSVRRYLAARAELAGAVRLPNDAFKANAGTEVTSDIVFLKKLERPRIDEPGWVHLGLTADGVPVNGYFVERPEMVLGRMVAGVGLYGRDDDTACVPAEGADLAEGLRGAVSRIEARMGAWEREDVEAEDGSLPADPDVRNYSFALVDSKAYYRIDSRMHPMELSKTAQSRVAGMVTIRDVLRELIELQREDMPDADVRAAQARLGALYDAYTAKYGLLTSRANASAFARDGAYPLLCALEVLDEEGNLAAKADMFTKRTIKPYRTPEKADTPAEALALSLAERARVDMPYMARLTGMDESALAEALHGVIYRVPGSAVDAPAYQTADEYLSGNVREKLRVAEAAAAGDAGLAVNVEALRSALPDDIPASEIDVRLGTTWVPAQDVQDFMHELLETPIYRRGDIQVRYSPATGQWNVSGKSRDGSNVKANSTFGTHRANAYRIIEDTLNLRDVRIFDYVVEEDGKRKPVLNRKETAIALAKQDAIKSAFKDWVFQDPARRERLTARYNELYNSTRPRTFDGSHLAFPGMSPEIRLRPHQTNAIARIIYGGNTLLAHEVGAGKTFEMVAAAQEMKRLGLCTKSLVVVPNHLTEQWGAEWLRLYPGANILVATKRDFETKNRKRFCARIATGDYDAVIIGHSQFEKIPLSYERQRQVIEDEINEITGGIKELKEARAERYSVRQLEITKKKLEARLKRLADQTRKDDVVTFEELGVDRLFVDEAHYYKNLFFYTKMRNVAGLAQSEAQKSSDLFAKCRYMDEVTGGKGIVFATGTPISNSMAELYTMQRYLQHSELRRLGLAHFDSWASTFGETVSAIELAPEGTGYRQKTRFSRFFNLPELMSIFKQVADVKTADTLDLPTPKVNLHNVSVAPSEFQQELVEGLAKRADAVRQRQVSATEDNMLLITNDGRKIALDQRLVNDMLPDNEGGKVSVCADNVHRIWEEGTDARATQLVFCDLSTPKADGSFDVYHDLKRKLMVKGIPENEIAFIHDAGTEAKKLELFARVNAGQVRVLMGSTSKMGAGTNVQRRLKALHDLDCPWRPSDLQQRLGRIERQGNENDEVDVFRYVTEGTFDAYLYQLVESKQRFISQIMTSTSPVRSAADVDETVLSYAELKALATGNPLIKERMDLDIEVSRLKLLKADHLTQRYALEDMAMKELPQKTQALKDRIARLEADAVTAEVNAPAEKEDFAMEVAGTTFAKRIEAGEALLEACRELTSSEAAHVGAYRGFKLDAAFDGTSMGFSAIIAGAARHEVALSTDALGCITRIDNAIERIPAELETCKQRLSDTEAQMANARAEAAKPFLHDDELREKAARLKELDALLDMDKPEQELCDEEPDAGPESKKAERER